jgi:hypothetical protein
MVSSRVSSTILVRARKEGLVRVSLWCGFVWQYHNIKQTVTTLTISYWLSLEDKTRWKFQLIVTNAVLPSGQADSI